MIKYKDTNEDGKINSSDKHYIGDANPDFTFGMTNTFSYKGFNLSMLITGSVGNDVYNASKIEMIGMYTGANQTTDVLRRWRVPRGHRTGLQAPRPQHVRPLTRRAQPVGPVNATTLHTPYA